MTDGGFCGCDSRTSPNVWYAPKPVFGWPSTPAAHSGVTCPSAAIRFWTSLIAVGRGVRQLPKS